MLILPNVPMPDNCAMCDAWGISDVVDLNCPVESGKCEYCYDGRPKECPLKETD